MRQLEDKRSSLDDLQEQMVKRPRVSFIRKD